LVVDDESDTADTFFVLLRSWGHEVRVAGDGISALASAVEFLPDVVLLDIGLPEMSGYDVAREIRRRPSLKDLVLVAITGFGQTADRTRAEQAGFDYHLLKPVDPNLLRSLLAALRYPPRRRALRP
jgi:CheY-like chemotaxis protein